MVRGRGSDANSAQARSYTKDSARAWQGAACGYRGAPRGSDGEESACRCRTPEFDPQVGKVPWRRAWLPTQYSCLENPKDRGAWWATVHGVTKSRTRLRDFTSHAVRQLSIDVGIPTKLPAIKEEDLQFLAESAYADACAPGNPKEASVEDMKALIRQLM